VFRHSSGNAFFYIGDDGGGAVITSDRRLKKDIEPMNGILDRLMAVQPVTFRFNHSPEDSRKIHGFIAQEVEPVFPDLVGEKGGYKSVNYTAFGPLAVEGVREVNLKLEQALKERDAELEALRSRLAELEARDEAREDRLARMEHLLQGAGGIQKASLATGGAK